MTRTDQVNTSPVITGPIAAEVALNLTARLHPIKTEKGGELYSVIFRGELIVDQSNDPECDAARALLAKGITGKLTMLDGKTGTPRTFIDIERAAKACMKEGPLRFAPYELTPSIILAASRVRTAQVAMPRRSLRRQHR